ncbi:MAG: HEAT repeat domain-containing protein [Candidatus Hodarchaeales archaeon]|jgi:HEAT repeat protein
MNPLTINEQDLREKMIKKLLNDPDKFERMFAARYLAKYDFIRSKSALLKALTDKDEEVVTFISKLLEE